MTDSNEHPARETVSLTADIVAAFVSNNSLPAAELPALLASVYQAVAVLAGGGTLAAGAAAQDEDVERPSPARIRKSITPDAIISFIDGKSYKTMKRHLGAHGLDPVSYRQRYGLPGDYPMVAPNYAAQRAALAKSIGLGRPGGMAGRESVERIETVEEEDAGKKRKARSRKAA